MVQRMRISHGSESLVFEKAGEKEIEKMWKEWKENPYVMYPVYFPLSKENFEKSYPHFYEFKEKWASSENQDALETEYAKKMFPGDADPKGKFNSLLDNIVYDAENYVVIRNVTIQEPQIGVNPNYGENVGKSILAEELGGHFICQALQLRKFETDLEKEYEKMNSDRAVRAASLDMELKALEESLSNGAIAHEEYISAKSSKGKEIEKLLRVRKVDFPSVLTGISLATSAGDLASALGLERPSAKIVEEARRANVIASNYASGDTSNKYLPEAVEMYSKDVGATMEAGAAYIRTKVAKRLLGTEGAVGTFFSVDKCDPLYLRAEEKAKRFHISKGSDEKTAEKMAEQDVVKNLIVPLKHLRSNLMADVYGYDTEIERQYTKEKKRTQRDGLIMIGSLIGLSALSLSPYTLLLKSSPIGGAVVIPYSIGIRTLRRLPGRLHRSLRESDRPTAKKLLKAGGKTKEIIKRPFSYMYDELEENPYASRVGRAVKSGAKKAGSGMKKGLFKAGSSIGNAISKLRKQPEKLEVKDGLTKKFTKKM
ncbi:MAG: hypothetical protein HZB68_03785, partial [Candidatus Aenigmarchaeota archaeon]|nr:hypothetical protein [Candidatus Aenigmarchaeota archaeon]